MSCSSPLRSSPSSSTASCGARRSGPSSPSLVTDQRLPRPLANCVVGGPALPVSSSGQITVLATAATRVMVRLRGYYTSAASTVTGSRFVPVPPATVVNNLTVAGGGTISFSANGATGANGIPASPNVKALAVNVIANQPTGNGHLQVWPAGTPGRSTPPSTSSRARPRPASRSCRSRPAAGSPSTRPPPPR